MESGVERGSGDIAHKIMHAGTPNRFEEKAHDGKRSNIGETKTK